MIKKVLTFCSFSILAVSLNAQCTIDPNVFQGVTDYGLEPTSTVFNGSAMGTATESQPYSSTIQIHLRPDTTTALGTFPVTQLVIDSLTGLPPGMSYLINPLTAIPGGSYGCVFLSGVPTVGMSSGGPNNDGIYPIVAYTTATVNIFSVPTDFPQTTEGYQLRIVSDNLGLLEPTVPKSFDLTYNGTDINACLVSFLKEDFIAELIDINGNRINSFTVLEGINTIEINHLNAGMYVVKVGDSRLRLIKF